MNHPALAAHALRLLGILALVLTNGFFVAAEFAFVRLRDTQLDPLIIQGRRNAKLARHILQNLTTYLSATQLGITMASLGLGWLAEPVFSALLLPFMRLVHVNSPGIQRPIAFAVGFAVTTFLQIVLGELGPKWLAIKNPLSASLWIAHPLNWFFQALYPLNWVLNQSAQWLLRRVGIEPPTTGAFVHSDAELRLMLGQDRPGSSQLSRDIVLNALDLSHRTVHAVMRPRKEIAALSTEATMAECIDTAEKTRYSRLPLCQEGDLDRTLGVVHSKDLFAMRLRAARGADLVQIARKIIYVPETTRLEKLLQLFLERKLHFAIVVDEYGGTVGMATLENILEEIVGQIQDEFDQEKPLLFRRSDTTWELDGALPVHELAEIVDQNLADDDIATASGWVTQRLGGFPKTGDVVKIGAYELRVEETDGMRVSKLKLTKVAEPAASE